MIFDFGNANNEQKKAIECTEGPSLVIAGPGTGKTFTLVNRAVYLIIEKKILPENIMIVTFTEKAAKEIITRISNELLKYGISLNINEMYIGTFHSICLRLIKENLEFTQLKKNFKVLDDFEQKYFIYQNIYKFRKLDDYFDIFNKESGRWVETERIIKFCNNLNEELVNADELIESNEKTLQVVGRILEFYNSLMYENNYLDFSNIQVVAYNLLNVNNEILSKIQDKIKYVMVDEYQDTNYIQEKIVFKLTENSKNLCVVGDDDQGLYRFRGATIRNILEFPSKFEKINQFNLVKNYRSDKKIVDFYNSYMHDTETKFFGFSWDRYRFSKQILACKPNIYTGTTVSKIAESDLELWCEKTLQVIKDLISTKKITNLNQVAFLFKSVKHDRAVKLAEYLEDHNIPIYSPRSDMFFQRREIKMILGCIIVMFPNYFNSLAREEYKTLLKSELQNYYINCAEMFYSELNKRENADLKKWIKLKAMSHSTEESFDYGLVSLFYQLLQFPLFAKIINIEVKGVNDTRSVRNLATFSDILNKFEYFHNLSVFTHKNIERSIQLFFNEYMRFLISGGINEYEDDKEYAPSGCVSFLTIHQSKGLEFPVVFVGSLYSVPRDNTNAILDSIEKDYYERKPFEPKEVIKFYDFWRLYYTAFSRAQNMLILSACTTSKSEPSKYFSEIFTEISEYKKEFLKSNQKFDLVKDSNLKDIYSFTSNIMVYKNCPTQYKFLKEFEFTPARVGSTVYGTLVHATIEDVHKLALSGHTNEITPTNVKNLFNTNYTLIALKEKTFLGEAQRDSALKQVMAYINRQHGDWSKVKDAEVEVSLVKDKYILNGKVDLIQGDNDSVEVVDFKAEKKPDIFAEKDKIETYKHQLEVYAHIIEERTGLKVSKIHIYYTGETSGNPMISFKRNEKDIKNTIKNFDIIVDKIQRKEFSEKSYSQKLCSNCDFRYFCKRS